MSDSNLSRVDFGGVYYDIAYNIGWLRAMADHPIERGWAERLAYEGHPTADRTTPHGRGYLDGYAARAAKDGTP